MTPFAYTQLPVIAQRILAERDAGREVDPHRIAWANDILRLTERGDTEAGRRCFVEHGAQTARVAC